jgi:hypothetical protein
MYSSWPTRGGISFDIPEAVTLLLYANERTFPCTGAGILTLRIRVDYLGTDARPLQIAWRAMKVRDGEMKLTEDTLVIAPGAGEGDPTGSVREPQGWLDC